jgi:hypothetical protein
MKKRFMSSVVAALAAVTLISSPALAAQTPEEIDSSVATYAQLENLVNAKVEEAYSSVEGTVESLVTSAVQSTIGSPDKLIDLVAPLAKASAKAAIAQYIQDERIDALVDSAVDAVAESEILNAILTNEFVTAVLNRTIAYAVQDIVSQLGLAADKEATAASLVQQIWTAPLVSVGTASTRVKSGAGSPVYVAGIGANLSYYNYDVTEWNTQKILFITTKTTPKNIVVTGWNPTTVGALASTSAGINAVSKAGSVVTTLQNIDWITVLLNASKRALVDEVTERIQAAITALKTRLFDELNRALGQIGVTPQLDAAADDWSTAGLKIRNALAAKAGAELNAWLDSLPEVSIPDSLPTYFQNLPESFQNLLQQVITAGSSYLKQQINKINWAQLFRGGQSQSSLAWWQFGKAA